GRLTIARQLVSATLTTEGTVNFGPTKTGRSRTVDISADTVALLRAHRRSQAELKLKNGEHYRDLGLVFAKEHADAAHAHALLGTPLQPKNISGGDFTRLLKVADVRRITFHGLRHTCATLLLQDGVHAKVVSERLGHSSVAITLDIYAHV